MVIARLKGLIWLAVIVVAAFGLYKVKYEVQAVQAEIRTVTRQLEQERENMHVVAAEWAYLNQPARLQRLATKFLALEPVQTEQLSEVADIQYVPFPNRIIVQRKLDAMRESPVQPVVLLRPGG